MYMTEVSCVESIDSLNAQQDPYFANVQQCFVYTGAINRSFNFKLT